jgi:hypothetical protein
MISSQNRVVRYQLPSPDPSSVLGMIVASFHCNLMIEVHLAIDNFYSSVEISETFNEIYEALEL